MPCYTITGNDNVAAKMSSISAGWPFLVRPLHIRIAGFAVGHTQKEHHGLRRLGYPLALMGAGTPRCRHAAEAISTCANDTDAHNVMLSSGYGLEMALPMFLSRKTMSSGGDEMIVHGPICH